jgi:hypothetical protein
LDGRTEARQAGAQAATDAFWLVLTGLRVAARICWKSSDGAGSSRASLSFWCNSASSSRLNSLNSQLAISKVGPTSSSSIKSASISVIDSGLK